ncbi:cytochrome P450 [Mycena galopus ATCC 62051]|nr:cytochrome P450 [Mycena galopus ATCC 62051]
MEHAIHYSALASVFLALCLFFRRRTRSAIRDLAGPPSPSWVFGHMRQLMLSPRYGVHEFDWLNSYGPLYAVKGCFGQDRLMVADPLAMQYILNSGKFRRDVVPDNMIRLLFGEGSVVVARGSEHRRLRSALNVGFTPAAVRSYQPVFKRVAETISDQFENFPATATDVCSVLSDATLDAISQAILGRSTKELGDDFVANNVELVKLTASQSETHILAEGILSLLPWIWPAMEHLPTKASSVARKGRSLAAEVGGQIVREKLDAAAKGLDTKTDLFGILVNPDDKTKALTEQDIVAQTSVILVAGQETTANGFAFGLFELATHPDFQDKLRAEIHSHSNLGEKTTSVAYDNMPLLNAFIKETLRLYPLIPVADRVALEDTIIPLWTSALTSTGERITQLPVRKGEVVTLGIASYQRLSSRWGKNPHEFNPYRWLDGETYQGDGVGPFANLLTFLGGPPTCLGWRFAILEMQVIFCELVAKFSFTKPENEKDFGVQPRLMTALMPFVPTGERALPLCVARMA